MRIPPHSPGRHQHVWFSPYLLAIGLSFALFQSSTPLSCKSGDTTLSEFQVIVQGQDRIVGFAPNQRDYNVALPLGTDEARVRSVTTDPAAQVWVDVLIGTERFRYLSGGVGGSDLVVPLPPGPSALQVWVRAPKGASDYYDLGIQVGNGTDFCFDQPVDCSASGECLTDGVCDPMCDPIDAANGLCDRCPGQDLALSDGTPCSVGVCNSGICASCPALTRVVVIPIQAIVGDDIDVSAEASGTGTIDYLWTATAGSFADPTAPITTYRCDEAGQQNLTVTLSDSTGSCADEYTVTVACSAGGDVDPPVITNFDFNPKSVDASSGAANLTCSITATDDGVGVRDASCTFASPSRIHFASCAATALASGDPSNGVWTCTATVAQGAEGGVWTATNVSARDTVINRTTLGTSQLQSLGFPTDLSVTSSAGGDVDPPVITNFDFNPKSVDASSGAANLTCSITATDD